MADILPPHNVEAEEAVLGSLMIDPEAALRIAPFLKPEMFYIVKNGWVYDAILKLQERRDAIDLLTVSAELERDNRLGEIGGQAYIAQLTSSVPTALNVETYAHLVANMHTRRKMIQAAGEVARIAYDQTVPVDQVIEKSEAAVFAVSEGKGDGGMIPMRRAVNDFFERIEYLHEHRDEPLGIPTGYPDLDKITGGMNKGDLIIVAARPGVGKSSLMLNLAYNAAYKYRQRVAIFSLEMGVEQLVQRFVASETGIDSQRLRVGDLRDDEWASMTKISMQMADLMVFLDDTPSLTPLDLRVKCRRIYQEHGLDLIIVDYLQLMTSENSSKGGGENRVQEISHISRNLKQIARELKVPLIAGSQLSRLVEQRSDKRPMLSDLRESGCLAGDTRVALADGSRIAIRELVGCKNIELLAINPQSLQIVPALVSHAFSTGIKKVFRLKTCLGQTIVATANHKFFTTMGWRRLDELHPESQLAVRVQHTENVMVGAKHSASAALVTPSNFRMLRPCLGVSVLDSVFVDDTVIWDQVESIEAAGEEEVFDLTVPSVHNFIANDIVVHNSIEQDADIVSFIYRDEVYNPDTDQKNIAEISVQKNRNGPTGKMNLFFDKRLTSFKNLAREKIEL